MINLSKRGNARLMIDSCPLVTGSKEPGKTAIRAMMNGISYAKIKNRAKKGLFKGEAELEYF
jgi:hypothetical protein